MATRAKKTKQEANREKLKKPDPQYGKYKLVEGYLGSVVVESEYWTAKANNDTEYSEFQSLLDKVDGLRSEKNYDWMADINLGVFIAHLLTETSEWVQQYFMTRDFVEVYLEGSGERDKASCLATKTLLNKTYNMRGVYHFQKYVRARIINWLFGQCWKIYFWEKETREIEEKQPSLRKIVPAFDDQGNKTSKVVKFEQPTKKKKKILMDRANYEVLDPRNVFTNFQYCYSAQQKPWVIVRSETNLQKMQSQKEDFGYFNLDIIESKLKANLETDVSRETYNYLEQKTPFVRTPIIDFDILDRYGFMWAIVKKRDEEDGSPTEIEPGVNELGQVLEKAELIETIVSFAVIQGDWTLCRYQATWAIDYNGRAYKPLVRSWNYIHPTKDTGLSDGKNLREIDTGINDTFNVSQDRTMLATLPTLKGKKSALEENPTVFIEPEHIIELENPETDLMELKIEENIEAALKQMSTLMSMASQADAVWPTTQGGTPAKAGETATSIQASESRTNMRGSYKSLTYEYTSLTEEYWIVNQMAYRFAEPETIEKLMGKKLAQVWNPDGDYTYVPLSQSIEAEHNKIKKVQTWDQILGRIVNTKNKKTAMLVNFIIAEICKLMGSDYRDFSRYLLDETDQVGDEGKQGKDAKEEATSNQTGLAQGEGEKSARETGNIAGAGAAA